MNKKMLILLVPISFIGFVGGMLYGLYFNSVGYLIMFCSAILTFMLGTKLGEIIAEKRKIKLHQPGLGER